MNRRTMLRIGVPGIVALVGVTPVTASLDGKGNDILTGIDDTAAMVHSGRLVTVTGHITCEDNEENIEVGVEVTKTSTGANAEGRFQTRCSGDTQDWTVRAPTKGGSAFERTNDDNKDSQAEVKATARTRKRGEQTDEYTWWNNSVSIIEE